MMKLLSRLFSKKKTILVIVGPTASGKSTLGIEIAKKYKGEIISADSRQIYKELELFSGAVTQETSGGVKHFMVSFLDLGESFSADMFVTQSEHILSGMLKRKKLPIIVGGTGFWVQSLMYPRSYPEVGPNETLRETMETRSTEELFKWLEEKDPTRAGSCDPRNRRRIMRSIEIAEALGSVPIMPKMIHEEYKFVLVYLNYSKTLLDERITRNVTQRIEQGLIDEAKVALRGLLEKQCVELGLGYKHLYDLKEGRISQDDFVDEMRREEIRYAKRQKTFFNKLFQNYNGPKIEISHPNEPLDFSRYLR